MRSARSIKVKRVAAAALFGLVLVQVIPALAEVITGQTQSESAQSPEPMVTVSPEPSAAPEGSTPSPTSSAAPQPTASITYSDLETATPAPTYAPSQELRIRIPAKFPVDPRATSVHISPISITGGEILLVCLTSDNAILKISGSDSEVLLEGNGSKSVRISGDGAAVNALLNAGRGLRSVATGKINGAVVTTRAASLTAPSTESELCSGAQNTVRSSISAMGLGMDTVKAPIPIK